MALELQVSGQEAGAALGIYKNDLSSYMETWNQIFLVGDILFTTFFCLDVTLRVCVMRILSSSYSALNQIFRKQAVTRILCFRLQWDIDDQCNLPSKPS